MTVALSAPMLAALLDAHFSPLRYSKAGWKADESHQGHRTDTVSALVFRRLLAQRGMGTVAITDAGRQAVVTIGISGG